MSLQQGDSQESTGNVLGKASQDSAGAGASETQKLTQAELRAKRAAYYKS